MIESLTSFTVTVSYGRSDTTFDVRAPGRSAPVARVHKASQYDSRYLYHVLAGPNLTEPAGYINSTAAWAADRSKLGTIGSEGGALRRRRWRVDQYGLPALIAHPAGVSAVRYRFPLSLVLTRTIADNVLPFKLAFRAPESHGFVVARATGIRASFTVTVHDTRVDRRLILACVVALNRYESADLRQEIVDLTANPFKL
jgi:hypothetical protein